MDVRVKLQTVAFVREERKCRYIEDQLRSYRYWSSIPFYQIISKIISRHVMALYKNAADTVHEIKC